MPGAGSDSSQTLYEVLGVPRNATPGQIEDAYGELVQRCLRDIDSSPYALQRLVHLHAAYDVLVDKQRRAAYDAQLLDEQSTREAEEPKEETLYEMPEAPPDATAADAGAAYRNLPCQYHPDSTAPPEALAIMQRTNAADDVPSDPADNATYDASPVAEEDGGNVEGVESILHARHFAHELRCQGCGRFDHTLRAVAFPYVVSFLVVSAKRHKSGIFCHRCRCKKSIKWAQISLLFGPWGLPWGVIWTLQAIITNFRQGEMPKVANQKLLQQLAVVNAALGRISQAKAALRDMLKYGRNEEAQRFKEELDRTYPTIEPVRQPSTFRIGFIVLMLAMLGVYGGIAYAASGNTSGLVTPVSTPDSTSPIISNVMAADVTGNSVKMTWATNEPATSQVEYGLTGAYGSASSVDKTLVATHSFALSNLQFGSTYHYRVKSADAVRNGATSYDSTFTTLPLITAEGFKVFYAAQPDYQFSAFSWSSGLELIDNDKATNPTWQQLIDFLEKDTVDAKTYFEGSYMCGQFARDVHNNAEAAGISAGFVCVSYKGNEVGHAFNVFETKDIGLTFVDCTGDAFSFKPISPLFVSSKSYGGWEDNDTVAYVEIGKPLGHVSADVARGPGYYWYESWQDDKKSFDEKLDMYNTKCSAYNNEVSAAGFIDANEYDYLKQKEQELQILESQLDTLASRLGGFWQQQGIVESVEIYW